MTRAFTTSQFIKKAIRVHGNKYDYSKTYYVNNRTEITIICAAHGRFYQLPRVHFSGHGCPRCGANTSRKDLRKTKSKFIQDAFQVHGDSYDYSKVEYINNYTKVKISCPRHGEFMQTPTNHISNKTGCPRCSNTGYSRISIQFLNDFAKEWKVDIQHAENKGEYRIEDPDFKCFYKADGFFELDNKK